MKKARMILAKLLHPPKWVLFIVPPVGFAALIFIFAANREESTLAYLAYCMSAYSLCILLDAVPGLAGDVSQKEVQQGGWDLHRINALFFQGFHDLSGVLFRHSSQKATAPAAATLRESTPWAMGMQTV